MRLIPTASTFQLLADAYFEAKTTTPGSDTEGPHDLSVRMAMAIGPSGVKVPSEIRQSKFGRGLFAKAPIPVHSAVQESTRYGIFSREGQWTTFLSLLPEELRCDVAIWAYVLEWDDDLEVVALDLDESSLINHGNDPDKDYETLSPPIHDGKSLSRDIGTANIRYDDETMTYNAIRDIAESEEILCDYTSFHVQNHSLEWFTRTCQEVCRGIDE